MIVNLNKYLFIGAIEDLDSFFEEAQNQGFLEFISIGKKKSVEQPQAVQNLILAHKILRKLPVKKPSDTGGDLLFAQQKAKRIIHLNYELEKLREQERLLSAEIARVAIFGDFSLEDCADIERRGHRHIQFFCMKSTKSHLSHLAEEIIYIGTEADLDYFITINKELKRYPDMIEMRIEKPLGELEIELANVKMSLHQTEVELKGFASFIDFLQSALVEELNSFHLNEAKQQVEFPLNQALFAIEAWVPQNKMGKLYGLMGNRAIHCEQILIEAGDRVPTYMENHGIARIGEDLVKIYDVPSTGDKDPSMWVLCAFTLFFSIIISDAGYGLIYLAIAAWIKYKFPYMKGVAKRLLKLFTILACGCIVWGVANSAYFGLNIHPETPLGKLSIINYLAKKKVDYEKSQQAFEFAKPEHNVGGTIQYEMLTEYTRSVILELSLMIGVVHISLGLLRYLRRNWSGIGWIIFMIGGYLYFPSLLKATSLVQVLGWLDALTATRVGLEMIYAGIGSAVVLALIQHRWNGLKEIANLVQIFADVLSYLRLYALALASAIMAETFNGIGNYIGFFAGVIALIVGHLANLVLGTGSGVIHGLRLNFIEWYHYCFEGSGRLFQPLIKLKIK